MVILAPLIAAPQSARADVHTRSASEAADDDDDAVRPNQAPPLHARLGLRTALEHVFVWRNQIGHDGPLVHAPFTIEGELMLGSRMSVAGTFAYAPSLTVRCTGNPFIREGCGLPFFRGGLQLAGRWAAAPRVDAWVGGGLHLLSVRIASLSFSGEGDALTSPSSSWSRGLGLDAVGGVDFVRGAARFGPLVTLSADVPLGVSIGLGWRVTVGS